MTSVSVMGRGEWGDVCVCVWGGGGGGSNGYPGKLLGLGNVDCTG